MNEIGAPKSESNRGIVYQETGYHTNNIEVTWKGWKLSAPTRKCSKIVDK